MYHFIKTLALPCIYSMSRKRSDALSQARNAARVAPVKLLLLPLEVEAYSAPGHSLVIVLYPVADVYSS